MRYPLFRRTCVNATLRMCSGVSVRKIMYGEWSSSMLTMSAREGLFAPAFCALIVRSVRSVADGGAAASDCECSAMSCAPFGVVIVSVCVGLDEGEASAWLLQCWVGTPGGVIICPIGEDIGLSSGCGESGG
jgi:hypothetical protein